MKYNSKFLFIGLSLFCASCKRDDIRDILIISNINIVDVKTGEIRCSENIWIEDDKILKIIPHRFDNQNNYTKIDAKDKYVIPGLWDMHAHIVDYDWVPKLYTSLGITGIRSMHGGSLIDSVVAKRKDGFFRGFEFLYSGPIVDGPGESWSGIDIAPNPEEGRKIVREQYERGYDFLKVYDKLDLATYMAIADECNNLHFPFAGHVPMSITTEQAIAAGQKSIEHTLGLEHLSSDPNCFNWNSTDSIIPSRGEMISKFLKLYDPSLFPKFLTITTSHDTWYCPTMVSNKTYAYKNDSILKNDERLKYIPKKEQEYWFGKNSEMPSYMEPQREYEQAEITYYNLMLNSLKPMLNHGARFLAGTDTSNPNIYPGFSLHEELQIFVKAGFTELEALQTATINPAIYTGREEELGSIEQGKIADLLILDKNPLENIKNTLSIYGLVRRGEYLNRDALNKLLDYNKN
ncbi:MAG: amidohydrolase family protein [Christiangramia sp.]|nr:amidohydrolase family protein [Christiangramia sp.]